MSLDLRNVVSVILGGGRGTRLYPLTRERAKPAVPMGGKYRLIDIPISNCINSGLESVYVLTQFNSTSLHRHIHRTYRFDYFSRGVIEILAAQQTMDNTNWYQGTADAVRQNIRTLQQDNWDTILILSGDQLYHMDYRTLIATHQRTGADATIAVLPVQQSQASGLGILQTDAAGRIVRFREKPKTDAELDSLAIDLDQLERAGIDHRGRQHLASMGIYVFNRDVLFEILTTDGRTDFGRDLIPDAITSRKLYAHYFDGYWEDVGTIRSFHSANVNLGATTPQFNFYDAVHPIYTRPRFLPAAKLNRCDVRESLVGEGSVIDGALIERSIVGIRSFIGTDAVIRNTVIMGADYYEDEPGCGERPPLGIGPGTEIVNAIVDKNVRIGRNVKIRDKSQMPDNDGDCYYIRDGIVIIPREGVVPDGTVI